jgi:NAD-dependent dihydropyrimidine dehydrogenase PreA subunit
MVGGEGIEMIDAKKRDRGLLKVDEQECKGCGLCIEACPLHVIAMSERMNHFGYRTAFYRGAGCTGCGVCFMVCPEPGAITVWIADKDTATVAGKEETAECASN